MLSIQYGELYPLLNFLSQPSPIYLIKCTLFWSPNNFGDILDSSLFSKSNNSVTYPVLASSAKPLLLVPFPLSP